MNGVISEVIAAAAGIAMVSTLVACGSRTGLLLGSNGEDDGSKAGACNLSATGGVQLASSQLRSSAIAIDERNVYWTNWGSIGRGYADGTIVQAPICGGVPITLAASQGWPVAIAVDGASVYWANAGVLDQGPNGAILTSPVGGGAVVTLASQQDRAQYVAVDATNVYWSTASAVMTVPKIGGLVTTLAVSQEPTGLVVIAQGVYWSDGRIPNSIRSIPVGGGEVNTLVSTEMLGPSEELDVISGLAADGEYVYWAMVNGYILRAPLGGQTVTTLASRVLVSAGLAVDSQRLYWSTAGTTDGEIVTIPLVGGTSTTLVGSGADGIAVNATVLAWTRAYAAEQGSVFVAAK